MASSDASLAERVLGVTEKAAEAVRAIYARGAGAAGATTKDDRTPLTDADRESHTILVAGLRQLTPSLPVISEEDGAPRGRVDDEWWLVDPLDGTKEFLKRTGEFTVNVALMRDARPVLGVVLAPELHTAWVAADGRAHRIERGTRTRIAVTQPQHGMPLRIVASRDHAGPGVIALLARVPDAQTLSIGSSLKFCMVAEGRADLYYRDGPTMEWDTAAAQAVLEAAGGSVCTLDGAPLHYGKPDLRNPHFVAAGSASIDWRTLVNDIA